jgi:hypothetical protein
MEKARLPRIDPPASPHYPVARSLVREAFMAADSGSYLGDQPFFTRMAIAISAVIVFGFAQHAALGRVDIARVPPWVHLHGVVSLAWLALFITQSRLAQRGSLALHRKLGWIGAALAIALVGVGSYTSIMALALHRQPPFFEPPFFLALSLVGTFCFGGLVLAAIVKRRETQWHRRLLLLATVLLLDPALGRLVPLPLTGGEPGEWIIAAIQLGIVGLVMRHDRKVLGQVHPATWWGAGVILVSHLLISLLSRLEPFIGLANGITGT